VLSGLKYGISFSLHLRKGKYYISVKAPSDIEHFYADKRCRRSTGTSDKALANQKASLILQRVHLDFDKKRLELDPFVEALRPYLEQSGINVNCWYIDGFIEHEFYGEDTLLWQVTGGDYEGFQRPNLDLGDMKLPSLPSDHPIHKLKQEAESQSTKTVEVKKKAEDSVKLSGWQIYFEQYVANTYLKLSELITKLGYAVPKQALQYLSSEEMDELTHLKQPLQTDYKHFLELLKEPKFKKTHLAKAMKDNLNDMPTEPRIKVDDVALMVTKFSDLIGDYLQSKTESKKERSQRIKACERVIEFCGDLPLQDYTKLHAYDLAGAMHSLDYSNSQINKKITYGRGLLKFAEKNRDSNGKQYLSANVWTSLELEDYGYKGRPYVPFSHDELNKLFALEIAPQERKLLSILISTGMRLDEASLLTWDRIRNNNGILCFALINDDNNVKLKNRGSHRYIPVPDVLKPIIGSGSDSRLFDYRIDQDGKAQAKASDAVMPYIRKVTNNDRKVAHSLRGNFKDLIRDLEIPKEHNDFITGHAQGDIAGKYGQGPAISKRLEIINRIEHPWLNPEAH
jgi:integrase